MKLSSEDTIQKISKSFSKIFIGIVGIVVIFIAGVIFFFPRKALVGTVSDFSSPTSYTELHTPKCFGIVGNPSNRDHFWWPLVFDDDEVDYLCYGIIYHQEATLETPTR